MGTYLSTPVTEKCKESGEALACPAAPLVWGVVDMQGWRKSMEDSHVAQTDVAVPPHLQTDQDHDAKVFGVFDGHGGAEVARFTQLYLVDVLTKQPTWIKEPRAEDCVASPVGQALVDTFHALDRMIDQPERRNELIRLRTEKPQPGERKTVSEDLPIPPEQIHYSPVDVVKIGESMVENRLDDIAEEQGNSSIEMNEMSSEKRDSVDGANESDEVKKEAVDEPQEEPSAEKETGASDVTESVVEDKKEDVDEAATKPAALAEAAPKSVQDSKDSANDASEDVDSSGENAAASAESGQEDPSTDELDAKPAAEANDSADAVEKDTKEAPSTSIETTKPAETDSPPEDAATGETDKDSKVGTEEAPALKEESETMNGSADAKPDNGSKDTSEEGDGVANEDDDSDAVVGKEDAAKLDQDLMTEESDSEKEDPVEAKNRKVTVMFQKLLNLGGNSGQMSLRVVDSEDTGETASESADSSQPTIVPTVIQNGRQICNLPDHPIHAGCTAIVAVLIGRKLTVANAGDSRAVLCRAGGRAEALSFDHKPQQNRELSRIKNAGGFVNQFGRVNGNLNLSRSIGDLKYKQVPGIHPAGQMITAEPDIVEVYLQSNDEFFILGCDGIWDCLTNNQAVKYVRERIDTMSPTEIGVQMLDEIISDDPRATQGIGGDNMTVMVIDLQPGKRSYRNKSE